MKTGEPVSRLRTLDQMLLPPPGAYVLHYVALCYRLL